MTVDAQMRSRTHRNVYAIGDAVSMPQRPKMAHNAMRGAQVAAANIARELAGQPADKALRYELMCIFGHGGGRGTYIKSDTAWGGTLSMALGGDSDIPGLSAEEAFFMKDAFGVHFLATGGNVRAIL